MLSYLICQSNIDVVTVKKISQKDSGEISCENWSPKLSSHKDVGHKCRND